MRVEFKVKVRNPLGLHTRPATSVVRVLQNSKSKVWFTYKKKTVNAKSILSLLMLAVTRNGTIHCVLEGEDAAELKPKLIEVLENSTEDVCTV